MVTQRLNDVFIQKWFADMTNLENGAKTYLLYV